MQTDGFNLSRVCYSTGIVNNTVPMRERIQPVSSVYLSTPSVGLPLTRGYASMDIRGGIPRSGIVYGHTYIRQR